MTVKLSCCRLNCQMPTMHGSTWCTQKPTTLRAWLGGKVPNSLSIQSPSWNAPQLSRWSSISSLAMYPSSQGKRSGWPLSSWIPLETPTLMRLRWLQPLQRTKASPTRVFTSQILQRCKQNGLRKPMSLSNGNIQLMPTFGVITSTSAKTCSHPPKTPPWSGRPFLPIPSSSHLSCSKNSTTRRRTMSLWFHTTTRWQNPRLNR